MVHRITMLLNSSQNDDDEMAVSEITELKSFRSSSSSITNTLNTSDLLKSPINISSQYSFDEEEEDDEILQSPKKMRSSNGSSIKVTSPITVSNIINHDSSSSRTKDQYCEVISTFKKLNTNNSCNSTPIITQQQPPNSLMSKSFSMSSMNQYLVNTRFEKSEQEVADNDQYFDSDEEYYDDDEEDYDEDGDFVFPSKFEEIVKANGNSGNPLIPSSNQSTPNISPKRVPTQDYKIKSESVKQNPDGTYSCPYPNCNKTIKGNKGNLSSHLRWHRRLDAEAGEARGVNPIDEGEEEFTTPTKPSQRGVQLRNQMIHYGLNLFRQDSQGKYLCFFDGCNLRMLTNFSRHIAKHERKGDKIKEDLVPLLPSNHIHGSPATSPVCKKSLSMSSPSSPTSTSSTRYQNSSPFSPNLSNSCSSIPLIIESSPNLNISSNSLNSISNSTSQVGESSRLKRKLSVNVKFSTPMHTSSTPSYPLTPSIHSYPYSAPCTPTTSSTNPNMNFNSSSNININGSNKFNILSPRSLSSPSFPSLFESDFRKGKLDSIISSDSDFTVPSSSPSASPNKMISKSTSSSNILSPLSPTSSCVPSTPTSISSRFQLPQVSLFKEIQWDYNRSSSPSSSGIITSKKPSTPISPPPFQPLSPTASSVVPFSFCSKPKSKEDEVVKSLLDLSHLY